MDFIFGTLSTDELKLINHRTARRGIHHQHDIAPLDPVPGQPVTITACVGPDLSAEEVVCYYTLDGSEPVGSRGSARNGHILKLSRGDVVWDTLTWGYIARWQGDLPPQPAGTVVRYRIGAWSGEEADVFADWPEVNATVEKAAAAFFKGKPLPTIVPDSPQPHTFTYHVDRLQPPAWAYEAVIYQIFVDRYFPGEGRDWLQADDLNGFCGGTLWGVAEKLDYIADLGVNCIWLSPTFASPSHHGYDVTDFFHVEPRLGGDEALHSLVQAAHARGIRVLLDLVCNHVSNEHPYFREAFSDAGSPYRQWFTFDESPVGYRTFFGVASMPQLNVSNPDVRDWLTGIARHWLREYDVDGYRLDYASGPGPDFWSDFWAACKAQKPDCLCFGEVVDAPSALRSLIGRLDGLLDFTLADAVRRTFALRHGSTADLERLVERQNQYFPADFLRLSFIDNHDMDRFVFLAKGNKEALRKAVRFQMQLSQPPIIYYGTEVGLSQRTSTRAGGSHISRMPMRWGDEQERDLLGFYKDVLRERQSTRLSNR